MAVEIVDYSLMSRQAEEMRGTGKAINTDIKRAYDILRDLYKSWYGSRYNNLVDSFNNIIEDLEKMLKLIVTDVPYSLEAIANNYSQFDKRENVKEAISEPIEKIEPLERHADNGEMGFLPDGVTDAQEKISTNLKNAVEKMDQLALAAQKMVWESSQSSETFKNTFNTLKNNITEAFNGIEKEFKEIVEQAKEEERRIEDANNGN